MGGIHQPWMGQNDPAAPPPPAAPPASVPPSVTPDQPAQSFIPPGSTLVGPIPGSTQDLESQVSPDQALQRVQQQAQAQAQQQGPAPGQLSPDNPHAKLVNYFQGQLDQMGPPSNSRGVKGALSNFFKSFGEAELSRFGVQPSWQRRQQLVENLEHANQLGSQWEEMQNMNRYRAALTNQMQQNSQFESQMQPLRLQAEQQAVQAGAQAATTIHPAMSAADLKSLGVPDDLATQYEGHPLTSADFAQLKDTSTMAGANTRIFDYGQDGSGPNKGQWLVDKQFNPIKQLSPISETGRATALQKQQFAQQNALVKGMQSPVYAYDPTQKATVLTTQAQASQAGMQAIRGVKETDIRRDTADTRVLNDVAAKANNVMTYASAMDSWNPVEKQAVANILSSTGKDANLEIGAFGTRFPTATINAMMNSESWHALSPDARNYVTSVLSLREASMGLQRVLTGTARANESQINALQTTLPGYEIESGVVRQKLGAFTQNIDMLRQGIPRIPGIDVVPVRAWSGPQSSAQQSVGAPTAPGYTQNIPAGLLIGPGAGVAALGDRVMRGLGLK
jgi:hypothetical protein